MGYKKYEPKEGCKTIGRFKRINDYICQKKIDAV